jgi:hypothetical protein
MKIIDNINSRLRDELCESMHNKSRVAIAASYFSIYAYQELKEQLENLEELKFIFTSPSFTTEKAGKAQREFYIPGLNREKSLFGTEFEIKLRNELTRKAIARECAERIRRKATFKSNITSEHMGGFINVQNDDANYDLVVIDESHNFRNGGQGDIDEELCRKFNAVTNDGRKMTRYSDLLQETISSIINVKETGDIASLFKPGGTTALNNTISGLNDFELICFIVVR